MTTIFECPRCHIIISFGRPSSCAICGCMLENIEYAEATVIMPDCPDEVDKRDCEKCEESQYKRCDNCGGTDRVKYCPQWNDRCLCASCRKIEVILGCLEEFAKK